MSVTPDKKITIAGKDYILSGTTGVLKALQQEFDQDVYDIATRGIIRMRFDHLARLIVIAIGEGGPEQEAVESHIVRERGLDETKYFLMEWLVAAVSTEKDREKNVKRLLEQIKSLKKSTAAL